MKVNILKIIIKMIPLHIPIVVHIICSSYRCDNMNYIQDLLKTNIGPRINHNYYISCSQTNKELIECDAHAPYLLIRVAIRFGTEANFLGV